MLFRRFEALIDPFRRAPLAAPPATVPAFYAHFIRQVWPSFALLLVLGLIVALIEVALFDFVGRIIDILADTEPAMLFEAHGRELLWMALIALLLRPLFNSLHDLVHNQAVNPGLTSLVRWQNHRHVLRQSLAFFQSDFSGRIANRVMQTGGALRESSVQVVDSLWYVAVYLGSAAWLFAQASPPLMLPLLVWLGAYLLMVRHYVPLMAQRSKRASDARSRLMGRIVDGYTNIMTLKLFADTRREEDYVRDAVDKATRRQREMTRLVTAMDFWMTSLNGLLIVVTVGLALTLWRDGRISAGDIALAAGLVIRISNMSGWILRAVANIFEQVGTLQDGIETISRPIQLTDAPHARPLTVTRGAVRFERVRFHYGRDSGVFDALSLDIAPGEKVGLVGPSGAGKSTLMSLLLRLHDLQGGRILIDGQDIAAVTQESLRAQIGVVTQDTALLHRTIRDNLLYGRPDATPEMIAAAVRDARADAFIPGLVDAAGNVGFDAHVGERGVKLSGGQRQRIAIARVLLKDAPLLVLDEATSALDSEVELAIQDSLERLMRGKTVIAIAHRLSTIARMDRLVVLERGRVVETGTHEQLVAAGGLYARLWAHQSGGFVAEDAQPA